MRIAAYLEKSPVFQIRRAARVVTAQLEQMFLGAQERGDLSFLEALLLVSIFFEHPRPVQPSRLAATFSTTRGNISHCISTLEAKGLLRRQIDPDDTRAFHLTLKPQGRKRALELIRILDRLQRQLERRIGAAEIESALAVMKEVEQVCSASPVP